MSADVPSAYHLCRHARRGKCAWIPLPSLEATYFASARLVLDVILDRYPGCTFALNTITRLIEPWPGPPVVAMAVCGAPDDNGTAVLHGVILGGIIDSGESLRPGHGPSDGCIPFDLDAWPEFFMNLPTVN